MPKKAITHTFIGLMSGTSLDGLDICAVNFIENNHQWSFKIIQADTIQYPISLKEKLKHATKLPTEKLLKLDIELGAYMGDNCRDFINKHQLDIDMIGSHGHTIFHQPENRFTWQIGSGYEIAHTTLTPVVFDFRSKDVSLNGQGAPLVPIGDHYLFSEYDVCINLGGIANLSYQENGIRKAFDICPFNMGFNFLANQLGLEYDDKGTIAKSGQLNSILLQQLNQLDFYKQSAPKSLGYEWFETEVLPLLSQSQISISDRLYTYAHHLAQIMGEFLKNQQAKHILLTGGGAYNEFFVELLEKYSGIKIKLPLAEIIDFKEAMIFAFLAVLRSQNKINVLSSVTGAQKDSSSGQIVYP